MKLLFDQNVSRRLVAMFPIEYPASQHVTEVGLDTATDAEIWSYAGEHDFVIVSKDSDFRQLRSCTARRRRRSGSGSATPPRSRSSTRCGTTARRSFASAPMPTRHSWSFPECRSAPKEAPVSAYSGSDP